MQFQTQVQPRILQAHQRLKEQRIRRRGRSQPIPLMPQMYCQKSVCEQIEQPFLSRADLAVQTIEDFEPQPGMQTQVLVDSWYLSKRLWKTVRKRHWDLTGGLKSNRRVRLEDSQGIVTWPTVSEYAAMLEAEDFQFVLWPSQTGRQTVYAHFLHPLLRHEPFERSA